MTETPVKLEGFGPQDLYARREKIFTRAISGRYQRLRLLSGWPLLVSYFVLPWLTYDGRQAVLFDLPARQFHILGLTFWPQDLWLLGWLLMIAAFALFSITTVIGRLWCGYTCPQTVWTAIYMWIEQVTEGSRHQRIRLDSAPWSLNKARKRLLKHAMWLTVAALTGFTFVAYFVPARELLAVATVDIANILSSGFSWSLFWVVFFTLATYINAGWLREQVCIYMCPYARFQSAMIDENTLTVAYDHERGEPRGSRKRSGNIKLEDTDSQKGDCINCQLCVQVCPTGIDIRDGLQIECIGCAQCIDACDQVMAQMSYEPGLIRYSSEKAISGGKTKLMRPRSIGYAAITLLLMSAFAWAIVSRESLNVSLIRDRDSLYQLESDGRVRNDYQLVLINKLLEPQEVTLSILKPDFLTISSQTRHRLLAGSMQNVPLSIVSIVSTAAFDSIANGLPIQTVELQICNAKAKRCSRKTTSFFAPQSAKGAIDKIDQSLQ